MPKDNATSPSPKRVSKDKFLKKLRRVVRSNSEDDAEKYFKKISSEATGIDRVFKEAKDRKQKRKLRAQERRRNPEIQARLAQNKTEGLKKKIKAINTLIRQRKDLEAILRAKDPAEPVDELLVHKLELIPDFPELHAKKAVLVKKLDRVSPPEEDET